MQILKTLLFLILITAFDMSSGHAQSGSTSTLEFKKGEVLDVIFFISRADVNRDSLSGVYRKVLFPIAKEFSFQPIPGFAIKKTLQGGHQPSYMVLGKWQDVEKRVKFIDEVVQRVPSFHDMRRGLWHTFYLTYYELEKDIVISKDPSKFKVASALWLSKTGRKGQRFVDEWINSCRSNGGKVVLQLDKGSSPSGYYYNPDSFMITEWTSREKYDGFVRAVNAMDEKMIQNINEFQI